MARARKSKIERRVPSELSIRRMSSIVSPSSFSVSNVNITPLKMMESGGKQAYLNYEKGPLVMQVGSLETPFGLSIFDKIPGAVPKYTVEMNLRGYDDPSGNPKVAAIYNALNSLDEYLIDQGVKNSRAWFKADLNRDMVKMFYTPTMRFAKDAEGNLKPYPPTLKIQLRQRDGKFETKIYDDKKRSLDDVPLEDVLVKRAFLTALIQCTGVWFAGGKFGLSWKALQIRADKIPDSIRGFAFLDDGDAPAASAGGGASAAPKPVSRPSAAPSNQFADLDDDQVDDDDALQPPAAPRAQEDDDMDLEAPPVPPPARKPTAPKARVVVKAPAKK